MNWDQWVEDEEFRLERSEGGIEGLAVVSAIEEEGGGSDDVEVEGGEREAAMLTELSHAVAQAVECVVGEVDEDRVRVINLEVAEAGRRRRRGRALTRICRSSGPPPRTPIAWAPQSSRTSHCARAGWTSSAWTGSVGRSDIMERGAVACGEDLGRRGGGGSVAGGELNGFERESIDRAQGAAASRRWPPGRRYRRERSGPAIVQRWAT